MPYATPDYAAILADMQREVANLQPDAATGVDSDLYVRMAAVAASIEGLYMHQAWLSRQILADQCDTEWLERHASLRGITRKPAAFATGSITLTGESGAAIPLGTQARALSGLTYSTTAGGTIGVLGTAVVAVQADTAGAAGNLASGAVFTLVSPPSGVYNDADAGAMTGGIDLETDDDLRARLLAVIRQPPHGGAAHDYVAWALEVAGVGNAWSFPLRRGDGTVDVVISPSGGGAPSGALITAVEDHIEPLRPVTADYQVLGPTAVPVAVTATMTLSNAVTLADVAAVAAVDLANYFSTLAPGDTAYKSQILAILATIGGVIDVVMSAPAANVTTLVDSTHVELATLGALTLS